MSISSLLLSLTSGEIKRFKKVNVESFESWLKSNRKSLIKRYTQDFHEKNRYKRVKQFDEKISDIFSKHYLSSLSRRHCLGLYSTYYKLDLSGHTHSNLVFLNILYRLDKVTDLKFNHYFTKHYNEKFIFNETEKRLIKNLEKHTFKIEMERMLKNKNQDKKKINKI